MLGTYAYDKEITDQYIKYLLETVETDFKGLKVVWITATAQDYRLAPKIFQDLGAEVYSYNCNSSGRDINVGCGLFARGVYNPKTIKHQADIGFAFDGDADKGNRRDRGWQKL